MQYILLDIGYQEILNGYVVRHTDMDGNTISPQGYGGTVVDANPPAPAWALPDPVAEEPAPYVPPARIISKLEYMNRFTDAELQTIYSTAKTVVAIEVWLAKFNATTDIDLDDPRTISGLASMEDFGLIALGRAQEILSA
jgi:hypothetical protein